MEAQDVVLRVLHKNITDEIAVIVKRGPKGYGLLLKLRLLLYGTLKEIFSTRKTIKHLKKRPYIWKKLGFKSMPSKRTIDRWKHAVDYELQQVITITGNRYLQLSESEWTILDSTPLVDEDDPDATVGYNSQGQFIGFKLHMSCDEKEVPLRATFTQAHVHDSHEAEDLLAPTPRGGGDSAYDSKELKKAAQEKQGMKLITVHNPRRQGKAAKKPTPKILKRVRICIEQCNGFVKNEVMNRMWDKVKGLKAKAVFAFTAVLAIQTIALYNLISWGYPSIRIQEVRI
jgi:hypothetical protein